MQNPFFAGAGGVLSADIAVPDHEREIRFYSRILTTGKAPLWRDDLTNNHGTPVIGLGQRTPEHATLPLQWMPHIQVRDVGASVAHARELGGSILMQGRDQDGQWQWAVVVDPGGAAFGLVPVASDTSSATDHPAAVGRIAHLTLAVPDVRTACRFYERVVGWSADSADAGGAVALHRPDGAAVAAICRAHADDHRVPPVWILGLPVGDLDASLRLVGESGGQVVDGCAENGRAVIRDPVGAFLALQANR